MARFAELWAETMPADADRIYAELGLTSDEAARLPHEIGELRERTLHVHALLLEPEFRRRADAIELGVESGNAPALRLYERTGFERVGERLGFLIMRKRV